MASTIPPTGVVIADAQRFFRLLTTAKELLSDLHAAPLDMAGRRRLARLFDLLLAAASETLPETLGEELQRLSTPLNDADATDGEVRVAIAELEGWLEGVVMSTPLMVPEDEDPATTPS